ncbi:NYN domain-containing protein [Sinorhizobium meliloti]|uniref:LabA-like NYN domain-containing protein n=1 Tax=Rhizobium meliloti TaxID=382 RepID=UPI000FD6FF52|nr:NYN domain-containing protein [Sinorhizobium meliloti]RVP95379.1 NYN domain-containing protein [Sinorhizobium meliloti]
MGRERAATFDQREKIVLLIDGANLFAAAKALGFDIDYRKLLEAFRKRAYLLRANYYCALMEDQEAATIRPLIDWLDYNGYQVVTKPVREFTDSLGRRKVKGNMDVELAIDALEMSKTADHLVIFSGDGNFTSLVVALQRNGRKVSVVSTMATRHATPIASLNRFLATIPSSSLRNALDIGREKAVPTSPT